MRTGFQFKKLINLQFGKNKDYGTVIQNFACMFAVRKYIRHMCMQLRGVGTL